MPGYWIFSAAILPSRRIIRCTCPSDAARPDLSNSAITSSSGLAPGRLDYRQQFLSTGHGSARSCNSSEIISGIVFVPRKAENLAQPSVHTFSCRILAASCRCCWQCGLHRCAETNTTGSLAGPGNADKIVLAWLSSWDESGVMYFQNNDRVSGLWLGVDQLRFGNPRGLCVSSLTCFGQQPIDNFDHAIEFGLGQSRLCRRTGPF